MPLARLGDALDESVALREVGGDPAAEQERLSETAEEAEGCGDVNFVADAGPVVHGGEVMFILVGLEGAGDHDLAEVAVRTPDLDQILAGALQGEVRPLPGDGLARPDESSRYSGDGFLMGGGHLQIDAESEPEATLHRRLDEG